VYVLPGLMRRGSGFGGHDDERGCQQGRPRQRDITDMSFMETFVDETKREFSSEIWIP
jgi:hypothetical protein